MATVKTKRRGPVRFVHSEYKPLSFNSLRLGKRGVVPNEIRPGSS